MLSQLISLPDLQCLSKVDRKPQVNRKLLLILSITEKILQISFFPSKQNSFFFNKMYIDTQKSKIRIKNDFKILLQPKHVHFCLEKEKEKEPKNQKCYLRHFGFCNLKSGFFSKTKQSIFKI